jgi:hypothetical protein
MYNLLVYRLKKPQKNIFCLKSINNEKGNKKKIKKKCQKT